jgi:prepilin-type N-terminal cleavage/methylation domain-containing protein
MHRRGFTLMEILVSVMIFSVVSLAMVGILSMATNLFRGGESARAANDEAIAVLSLIDHDLRCMVPAADGGFIYSKVLAIDLSGNPTAADSSGGNMILAIKIRNPDLSAITQTGKGSHLIVLYWVDTQGILYRDFDNAADSDDDDNTVSDYAVANNIYKTGNKNPIARGCLYFGVDLSLDTPPRTDLNWSSALPLDPALSTDPNDLVFITEKTTSLAKDNFPAAIRLTLAITGGNRNATVGSYITQDSVGIRVAGVRQVPTAIGSMACIGDIGTGLVTWVEYDNFKNGVLSYQGGPPPARRRTPGTGSHARGDTVRFCPSYSLVRNFAR